MQIDLTASPDACQSSAFSQEDKNILWLQPCDGARSSQISKGLKSLLNISASIGLGAFLAISMSTATTEPAAAAEPQMPQVAQEQPSSGSALAQAAVGSDPLETIDPGPAADVTNHIELQKQIILSMPLTEAPATEGDNEESQILREAQNYVEFDDMRVPRWIVGTILRVSELTDSDPAYMMALADKESSFLPANKASTSSAEGLFQFITSTWLEAVRSFGPKHGLIMEAQAIEGVAGQLTITDNAMREHILGLRRNPYIAGLMAAEMMQRDKAKIEKRLGRKLSRSEFYMSHFFGVDSASKFIALVDDTPKKSAESVFPKAAKANRSLFYTKEGKKTRQLSVAEVYDKIDAMMDKRIGRYEDVSVRATADASL
jgi:hypothetical protein